jgi:uncharacterized protein
VRRSDARSSAGVAPVRLLSSPIRSSVINHEDSYTTLRQYLDRSADGSYGTYTNKIRTKIGQRTTLNVIAAALVIVGGLNWGLVAIAEFDVVAWLFGEDFGTTNAATRIVYGLVGLAAVYGLAPALGRRQSAGAHRAPAAAPR